MIASDMRPAQGTPRNKEFGGSSTCALARLRTSGSRKPRHIKASVCLSSSRNDDTASSDTKPDQAPAWDTPRCRCRTPCTLLQPPERSSEPVRAARVWLCEDTPGDTSGNGSIARSEIHSANPAWKQPLSSTHGRSSRLQLHQRVFGQVEISRHFSESIHPAAERST